MRVPNAATALVEESKICDYLLRSKHPGNRGKAAFFESLGYDRLKWRSLAEALVQLAMQNDIKNRETSPFGEKFIVDGAVIGPNGRKAQLRTVWIDEGLDRRLRLVTAYPVPREKT